MSDLAFWEKAKFEEFLEMRTGFVLDFTDRSFQEFVSEVSSKNIYDGKCNF